MLRLRAVAFWAWAIGNLSMFAAWLFVVFSDVHMEIRVWWFFGVHVALMALSFPLGVVWYFVWHYVWHWGVELVLVGLYGIGMSPAAGGWFDGVFAVLHVLGISVCGYVQWFVIVPRLYRRGFLKRRLGGG